MFNWIRCRVCLLAFLSFSLSFPCIGPTNALPMCRSKCFWNCVLRFCLLSLHARKTLSQFATWSSFWKYLFSSHIDYSRPRLTQCFSHARTHKPWLKPTAVVVCLKVAWDSRVNEITVLTIVDWICVCAFSVRAKYDAYNSNEPRSRVYAVRQAIYSRSSFSGEWEKEHVPMPNAYIEICECVVHMCAHFGVCLSVAACMSALF